MSVQGVIKRYILIVEKIESSFYPTRKELREFLEDEGLCVSTRTIQRDIEQIRYEFKLDLQFSAIERGYFIEGKNSLGYETFSRFLEIGRVANVLDASLENQHLIIDFEKQISSGTKYLATIADAISRPRQIRITYKKLGSTIEKGYALIPSYLKEYEGRWYMLALDLEADREKTFSLDNLMDVEVSNIKVSRKKGKHPSRLFEDVVGVSIPKRKPELLELKIDRPHAEYVKSFPIHVSQKLICEHSDSITMSLFVAVNYEFVHHLLKDANSITVVKPMWLRLEIIDHLKDALNKY